MIGISLSFGRVSLGGVIFSCCLISSRLTGFPGNIQSLFPEDQDLDEIQNNTQYIISIMAARLSAELVREKMEKVLGYKDNEIANNIEEFSRFINPEDLSMVMELKNKIFEEKREHFEIDYRMKHKAGRWTAGRRK